MTEIDLISIKKTLSRYRGTLLGHKTVAGCPVVQCHVAGKEITVPLRTPSCLEDRLEKVVAGSKERAE